MSHAIRTPMNGVVGVLELLQQRSVVGSQLEMARLTRESAEALLKIIERARVTGVSAQRDWRTALRSPTDCDRSEYVFPLLHDPSRPLHGAALSSTVDRVSGGHCPQTGLRTSGALGSRGSDPILIWCTLANLAPRARATPHHRSYLRQYSARNNARSRLTHLSIPRLIRLPLWLRKYFT
jgi:hypothetical protein